MLWLAATLLASLPLAARGCAQQYWHRGRLLAEAAPSPPQAFSYSKGGADWAGLCSTGSWQSPIGIQTGGSAQLPQLPSQARAVLTLGIAQGLRVFNTGHFVQVEWDSLDQTNASVAIMGNSWTASGLDPGPLAAADSSALTVTHIPVTPIHIHWHSVCEHIVDGAVCPLELHIVAVVDNTTGAAIPPECTAAPCTAIFAVQHRLHSDVYAPGAPFYDVLLASVPSTVGPAAATHLPGSWLDLSSLLPQDDTTYVTYSGSYTTPPCLEGALWAVFLSQKQELSAGQIDAWQALTAATVQDASVSCPAPSQGPAAAGPASAGGQVQMVCSVPSGARTKNRNVQPLGKRTLALSPDF